MHVRDYEVATTRKLNKEYMLTFDAPDDAAGDLTMIGGKSKPKGAYYATLGDAQTLRKRRPRVRPDFFSSFTRMLISFAPAEKRRSYCLPTRFGPRVLGRDHRSSQGTGGPPRRRAGGAKGVGERGLRAAQEGAVGLIGSRGGSSLGWSVICWLFYPGLTLVRAWS